MSTQSNAIPQSPVESRVITPAAIPATRLMYWSVRRELWESRWLYLAPLVAAAVALFAFLFATLGRALSTPDSAQRLAVLEAPYRSAEFLLMGTMILVSAFYCLDALYGERRDRSILFWKSLPVSDLTVVLAKAGVAIVLLPLLTFAITIAAQFIMLLLTTAVALTSGLSVAPLWTHVSFGRMSLGLFLHLLGIHGFWYAPFYAWLLLVSAWARRAPFLWAALPPFAIAVVEKIAFNTSHFTDLLLYRISGGAEGASATAGSSGSLDPLTHLHLGEFVISSGLWNGLALAAIFLAAAVRLRRYRGPV